MSVIWIAFALLLLTAAVSDARGYRIPNWISIALVLLFIAAAIASAAPIISFWPNLAVGAAVFAAGYLLFAATGMGAGDAKLAAAVALWAGSVGFFALCIALAVAMALLAGGLVGLRMIIAGVLKKEPKIRVLKRGEPAPLGVAISGAAIAASRYFDGSIWAF